MTDIEKKIGVLLVGHDPNLTRALTMLLQAQADIDVVGEIATAPDILEQVKKLCPDLILLDWDALGAKVGQLLKELQTLDAPPAIIGLSIRAENRQAVLDVGGDGFAYKGDSPDRLLQTIRAAVSNNTFRPEE